MSDLSLKARRKVLSKPETSEAPDLGQDIVVYEGSVLNLTV